MFLIYLPAGLAWLMGTAMEMKFHPDYLSICMFCKGDICVIMKRGFGAKLVGGDIKLDVFDIIFSFTVDMTESKRD